MHCLILNACSSMNFIVQITLKILTCVKMHSSKICGSLLIICFVVLLLMDPFPKINDGNYFHANRRSCYIKHFYSKIFIFNV